MRRDSGESTIQCDRRVLKELHQHVCHSLNVKPQDVLSFSAFTTFDAKFVKLSTAAVTADGDAPANSLESQVWFAQVTSPTPAIYLGLVNAGDQLPSDGQRLLSATIMSKPRSNQRELI